MPQVAQQAAKGFSVEGGRTKRPIALFALGALLIAPWSAPARAASLPDTPVGAEVAFVKSVHADLMKRFSTAAAAERAGFFRYTDEDNTGAISYTNGQWQTEAGPLPWTFAA